MIFRAMVSAYLHDEPDRSQDERVMFIEAVNRDDARARLPALVALLWSVPADALEIYNLESEFDLTSSPFAKGLSREHALFVIGWEGGAPTFVNGHGPSGHAIFFLARDADRLMRAYVELSAKGRAGD